MSIVPVTCEARLRQEIAEADERNTVVLSVPGLPTRECWALFAETELLNRVAGNPSLRVERIPVRPGVARRIMTTVEAQPVVYEEEYYQWEEGAWYATRRLFPQGPLEQAVILVVVSPEREGSRVEISMGVWARVPEGRPIAAFLVSQWLPGVAEALGGQLEDAARMAQPAFTVPLPHPERIDRARLHAARRTLLAAGEDAQAVERLVSFVGERADHELSHMAPLALADRWRLDRETVLDAFLRAARIRFLEPRWSVACPSCRGPKATTEDIAHLTGRVHCDDCNLTFDANPAENLQLTFTPGEAVRPIAVEWACVGGPARTPHIKAQAYLPPGETLALVSDASSLPATGLRLRCPDLDQRVDLERPGGVWRLEEGGLSRVEAQGRGLEISNATGQRVRVVLEDARFSEQMLRAGQVLERPRFRELFAADQWEFLCVMERAWREAFGVSGASFLPRVPDEPYDLVVIGSGPAGEAAAVRAARLGRRVALVEARRDFGGSSGLSSKAFREAAAKVLAWSQAGEREREASDVRRLFEERFVPFKQYVTMLQTHEVLQRLGRAGVDLYHGVGSLSDGQRVRVDRGADEPPPFIQGQDVLVATGGRAARPGNIPFDQVYVRDAIGMRELTRLPGTLCVVGTGVIALEYATIMAALGVRVVLVHGREHVLPAFDRELADALRRQVEAVGVRILSNETVATVQVRAGTEKPVAVTLASGATVECDMLLYAVGQDANTDGLRCAEAGVEVGRYGRIVVDAAFRTTNPRVYAAGDVVGPPGLASTAAHQGKVIAEHLFRDGGEAPAVAALFPTGLWTMPEVATVGLSEEQAREQGLDFVCGYGRFRDLPRGILNGDLHGWVKLVVERGSLRLLGVHIIGESACELIHYGSALLHSGVSMADVAHSVFAAATFHGLYEAAAEDALAKAAADVGLPGAHSPSRTDQAAIRG